MISTLAKEIEKHLDKNKENCISLKSTQLHKKLGADSVAFCHAIALHLS